MKSDVESAMENAQTPQNQKIQQLQERLEQIQKELIELKRANSTQPEKHLITSAKASGPSPALSEGEPEITDYSNPQSEPFAFADFTWLTGNARTKDTPYATRFFPLEIRSDVNFTYNHPQDDTISGSSEIFRSNEVQLMQFGVGGNFHYDNVRALIYRTTRFLANGRLVNEKTVLEEARALAP